MAAAPVVCAGFAGIAAFAFLTPASNWSDPVSVAALAAIAAVAYASGLRLKLTEASYFDASIALALLALAIGGPIPALLVWLVPDTIARFVVRVDPIGSPGHVATVSSFALAIVAGSAILGLDPGTSAPAAPTLYTAGIAMYVVNFVVARVLFASAYQGFRVRDLVRSEFMEMAVSILAILSVTVLVWALMDAAGIVALALFAAIVLVPQFALQAVTRRRSISRRPADEAAQVYAAAIADELGLSRLERRLLGEATVGPALSLRAPRRAPRHRLLGLVELGSTERWDGTGYPFGARGAGTLRVSRVVAAARTWASLTAAGSPGMSQTEAMLAMELRSGSELDPSVVRAAGAVVAAEKAFLREPDFEPRLHTLPIPRTLRRQAVPALLGRLAGSAA
jgi:hypothetical protein